jgi:pimeloyl-ACP methyl ester carboxylesterase
MERRRIFGGGLAVTLVVGLVGSSLAAPAAAARDGSQVAWGACPAEVAARSVQLECATVQVPRDYAQPDGTTIELMLSRIASANPEKRRGILLLNPGGPGGPGLTLGADLVDAGLPNSVLDAYDLIGMDTRGVEHSTPLSCGFTAEQGYRGNVPPWAGDDAAVAAEAERSKGVAEQCAANDKSGLLPYVTTANNARDLDRIRQLLGEEKASYLGYSYGSALGAAWASMFPATTDRVIIDSNLPDTHLDHEGLRRFALGVEDTFIDFAKWAAARNASYGLGSTPEEVRKTYFELAERLDKNPIEGVVDGPTFRMALFGSLYNARLYGPLAQVWQYLDSGDTDGAKRQLAALKQAEGTPATYDNMWSVFIAVTCNDVAWPEDVRTYQRDTATDRKRHPFFGGAAANINACAFWKTEPREPAVTINDRGPRNIMIMQNRRDPVTPLRNAQDMRKSFAKRSQLVSVDGSGHGVYTIGGNACAMNIGTTYLLDGKLPAKDISCAADGTAGAARGLTSLF